MITITIHVETKRGGWLGIKFSSPPAADCTQAEIDATKEICAFIRKYAHDKGAFEMGDQ